MDPKMFLYLFDHLIKSIVGYCSEVWGFRDWDELETLYLQACKYALGVRSTTTSAAVYSELGRRPLIAGRLIASFKYANRLKNLSCDRYAKKAYDMMVQDDAQGHCNWISELLVDAKKLSICGDLNNKDVKSFIFRYYANLTMKDIKQAVIEKKKLKTYGLFKTVFKQENISQF